MDIFQKIKKTVNEPKIYAVLLNSAQGQILHLGVHFTLEEAYTEARKKLEEVAMLVPGESVELKLWNGMEVRQAIANFMDPNILNEVFKANATTAVKGRKKNILSQFQPIEVTPELLSSILEANNTPPLKADFQEAMINGHTHVVKDQAPAEEPSLESQVRTWKIIKNEIMKRLIEGDDLMAAEAQKATLGINAYKYVIGKIQENRMKPSIIRELKKKKK